jgi:hypothetical protein
MSPPVSPSALFGLPATPPTATSFPTFPLDIQKRILFHALALSPNVAEPVSFASWPLAGQAARQRDVRRVVERLGQHRAALKLMRVCKTWKVRRTRSSSDAAADSLEGDYRLSLSRASPYTIQPIPLCARACTGGQKVVGYQSTPSLDAWSIRHFARPHAPARWLRDAPSDCFGSRIARGLPTRAQPDASPITGRLLYTIR